MIWAASLTFDSLQSVFHSSLPFSSVSSFPNIGNHSVSNWVTALVASAAQCKASISMVPSAPVILEFPLQPNKGKRKYGRTRGYSVCGYLRGFRSIILYTPSTLITVLCQVIVKRFLQTYFVIVVQEFVVPVNIHFSLLSLKLVIGIGLAVNYIFWDLSCAWNVIINDSGGSSVSW